MQYRRKKSNLNWLIQPCFIVGLLIIVKGYLEGNKKILQYSFMLIVVSVVALVMTILISFLFQYSKKRKKKVFYLSSNIKIVDQLSGEEFEEYLKAHFERKGYKVHLTAKSGDYGVDLICTKHNSKIAIQAKRYQGKVGIAAIQQIIGGMSYYGCSTGMVVTNSYFTKNAQNLAQKSNVILWDRDEITKLFKIQL